MNITVFHKISKKNIIRHSHKITVALNSASGHKIKAKGSVTVQMYIDNVPYTTDFILTDGFKFDLLIGSDFSYKHKAKLDFTHNTLTINKRTICLKPKSEIGRHSLLISSSLQYIEPYSVAHIETSSKQALVGKCIISPLDSCPLFLDQPGLVSPSIVVNATSHQKYFLPVTNHTGVRHCIAKNATLGFMERINDVVYPEDYIFPNNIEHSIDNIDCDISSSPDKNVNIGSDLNDKQTRKLMELIGKYEQLFVDSDKYLTRTNLGQATLDTGDHPPIKQRPYKNPLALEAKLEEQINDMLEAGIISPSCSAWSSPVVMVPKRDSTYRVCIDYRKLNAIIRKDSYPLPRIDDLFSMLGKAKYFSCIDLKSGYYQIEIAPEDREKTAFCTRTQLLEFNVMPMGVAIAPLVFQRVMSRVLKGIEIKYAIAYLDDILVFSEDFDTHLAHIEEVFTRLKDAKLSINRKKCHFIKAEIEYLGHIISASGIRPNPEKVRAIQTLGPPTNVRGVRSMIGLVGYYRNFIPQFSAIARPLTHLTKKNVRFEWTDECQQSFEYLKQKLVSAPILAYPDLNKPYSLYTDASDYAIGGILTQDVEGGERVIQYVSHQLTPNRLHYAVIEKEAFALVYCITKLKQYLLGADVTCYTDHKPLKSLFTAEMKNTRIQRWAILIDEYQVKIKYKRGIHNVRADALSRIRIKPTPDELTHSRDILAVTNDHQEQVTTNPQLTTYPSITFRSDIDIVDLQRQDIFCKTIFNQLNGTEPNIDYVIKDNKLYHIAKIIRYETEPILQLVVPSPLHNFVINGYHSAILGGGHVGLEKTYQKIRSKYFWQNCYKDVVEYVNKCEVCQRRMLRKLQAELQDSEMPSGPLHSVGIDTVGPFVTSPNGNRYLVTVVDWYTSWVEAYPIPNKEANSIAQVLLEQYIPRYGCPVTLISDRGTEYVNQAIDMLSSKMKVNRKVTTAYHPSGNGKTERSHRFLNDIIAKSLQGRMHEEWEQVVPAALFAMRTSVNESTKFTPYFLMFGRDPILPLDTLLTPSRRY